MEPLSDLQLSDLFFNYHHPHFDNLPHQEQGLSMMETRAAILKDAIEFVQMYPQFERSAEWFADDFMHRL